MGKSEEVTSSGLLVAGLPPITDSEARREGKSRSRADFSGEEIGA